MSERKPPPMTIEQRQKALVTRQLKAAAQPPKDAPQLFIVRLGPDQNLWFGWEIRKFGSIVLSRSETGFETQVLAQTAGEKVLTTLVSK